MTIPSGAIQDTRSFSARTIAVLIAAHVVLGLVCKDNPQISLFYALGTLVVGAAYTLSSGRPEAAAFVAAYIAGVEVLWRMTKAGVWWEYGKYATVIVLVLALLKSGAWVRVKMQPLLCFLFLIPSVFLTVAANDNSRLMRNAISFNLSGQIALFISIWYFSSISLTRAQLGRLYVIAIAPICGIAAIVFRTVAANPNMVFGNVSNFSASGGFGPNQVASSLSLGVLICFLFLVTERANTLARTIIASVMVIFAAQSALTFSRSGIAIVVGAILAASMFFIRVPRVRITAAIVGVAIFAVADYYVLPLLHDVTGGAIAERFQNTDLDGRDEIMLSDLQIFAEHPLMGVGPGVSYTMRTGKFEGAQAHTEFTRLLADHGMLGFVSICLLLSLGWKLFRRAQTPLGRAYVVALLSWSFLYMVVNAMRLVAPAFCIGLAALGYAAVPRPVGARVARQDSRTTFPEGSAAPGSVF